MSEQPVRPSRVEFLWKVLGRFDAYIGATLTRAGLAVAFNSLVVGSIVLKWSDLFGAYNSYPASRWIAGIGMMLATVFSLLSTIMAFRAIGPFLSSPSTLPGFQSRIFFGDVSKFESRDHYVKSVTGATDEELELDLATQVHVVAGGLNTKFDHLRWASGAMMGSLLCIALVVAAKFYIIIATEVLGGR